MNEQPIFWAMESGVIVAAVPIWIVSLAFGWHYTSSPLHSVVAKGIGWFVCVPFGFCVGLVMGQYFLPTWWIEASTAWFASYGILLVWLVIAVVGDEDFIELAVQKFKQYQTHNKEKTSTQKTITYQAPDRSRGGS